MFKNVRPSRFWEDNLRQRYGFIGPRNAFTDKDCMLRAMGLFLNFFDTLQYGYGFLVTLNQSVLAVEHDQRVNDYGRAVLKRFKFLLKHSHTIRIWPPQKTIRRCHTALRRSTQQIGMMIKFPIQPQPFDRIESWKDYLKYSFLRNFSVFVVTRRHLALN